MSASLIGHLGSSAFRLSTAAMSMSLAGSCFSSESAPRPFQHGNEVEQSYGRPCRQWSGRSKQTCELTSSIVQRGTSFHCSVDLVDRDRLVKNPLTVSSAVLERIASEAAAQGRRPAGS